MPKAIPTHGAHILPSGHTRFRVWAPGKKSVSLVVVDPEELIIPMQSLSGGWFECQTRDAPAGTRYLFELDAEVRGPDPASHFQPEGVHGPSEVVDHESFDWKDTQWKNIPLEDYIFYELHVGTFTPEGTFNAVIPHIPYLKELGITAVELMPVAQFPGTRNWGYDGANPFAIQNSYGGPEGLKRLVNELHKNGLAAVLDVVYNHLGPEGNYLPAFGPYFTDRYHTPWGNAINFDGPNSDAVRHYFINNALFWADEYHIDALRLDAIHGIFDKSQKHILRQLHETVEAGTNMYLIAESDLNDPLVITPEDKGGYGLNAQWNDDFHHCVHTLLTHENKGYYIDFGDISHLAKALGEGFVYSGQHSAFRKRPHGGSTAHIDPWRFVHSIQNHDQVGNRATGDRLSSTLDSRRLRLAAALCVLFPPLPLLFMGEEYSEKNPFQYFVDHSDKDLVRAVRQGRKKEFPLDEYGLKIPAPDDEETFLSSKLNHSLRDKGTHKEMLEYYKGIIALRKSLPALRKTPRDAFLVHGPEEGILTATVRHAGQSLLYLINLSEQQKTLKPAQQELIEKSETFRVLMDSSKGFFVGRPPESVKIYSTMQIDSLCLIITEINE